jgi:hypothetical protein
VIEPEFVHLSQTSISEKDLAAAVQARGSPTRSKVVRIPKVSRGLGPEVQKSFP